MSQWNEIGECVWKKRRGFLSIGTIARSCSALNRSLIGSQSHVDQSVHSVQHCHQLFARVSPAMHIWQIIISLCVLSLFWVVLFPSALFLEQLQKTELVSHVSFSNLFMSQHVYFLRCDRRSLLATRQLKGANHNGQLHREYSGNANGREICQLSPIFPFDRRKVYFRV